MQAVLARQGAEVRLSAMPLERWCERVEIHRETAWLLIGD